ncbi:MAG TPA: NAD(P)/FAD-dependent oxidoreductase [Mycobacteriales bacterium]|nr:NAD(P)/FAD-dependent oxidoreductase [Mycobacteriales bacterium]
MADRPHILIVGGGYVGMYTALRLQRKLRRTEADITVVDPRNYMQYQPFLPETAAGSLEPRHVVVPLRKVLRKCRVVTGTVTGIDHGRRVATVAPLEGPEQELAYDVVVVAPGSVVRTLPIPGLAEEGIGFKTVAEAIYLRNHVLSRLDYAASVTDEARRRKALTFVFIGGGYAGVEAFAELEDMARYATRYYPDIRPADLRWVLVEAAGRILPEVSVPMSEYTVRQLLKRDLDVRLETRVESLVGGHVVLSDGEEFDAETIVWTAGVKAHPMLTHTDLPLDAKGRLVCTPDLRVAGVEGAWSAGDCAAVPDLTASEEGVTTSPSAQHAVRQAKTLAANIAASLRHRPLADYKHKHVGSVASLGLYRGVAEVYGIKLRGVAAWFMHRTYHLSRMPTLNRKSRVLADWTMALFFPREVVSLGQLAQPKQEFQAAARPAAVTPAPDGRAGSDGRPAADAHAAQTTQPAGAREPGSTRAG